MEYSSYSESTFEKFIIKNVCQDDKTLVRYLKENNKTAFRNRLAKFPEAEKKIQKVVLSMFTEALRDVILSQISLLTKHMAPFGFLIVGGGIKDVETAKSLVDAGADALVIGTFLEKGGSLEKLEEIAKAIQTK